MVTGMLYSRLMLPLINFLWQLLNQPPCLELSPAEADRTEIILGSYNTTTM